MLRSSKLELTRATMLGQRFQRRMEGVEKIFPCMIRACLKMAKLALILDFFLAYPSIPTLAVTIPTVTVGNPGNAGDVQPLGTFGSVSNSYRIGKYEVTNNQYVEFLNAVAKSDPYQLYNPSMNLATQGGIVRSGSDGSYFYEVKPDALGAGIGGADYTYGEKPVVYVSWYDGIRFANWLHNGQGAGDTETGAYTLGPLGIDGVPINGDSISRNPGATWFLPNGDEWHKAGYHKNDGVTGNYWDYPTSSDTSPDNNLPANDSGNSSNYGRNTGSTFQYPLTDVGAYSLSESPYGTLDQGGNVWEWNETLIGTSSRASWGGSWDVPNTGDQFSGDRGDGSDPTGESISNGFRVAALATTIEPLPPIDGGIIRSFPSPLSSNTYGIAIDNDGMHAWVSNRSISGGFQGEFTKIDLFGNEVATTRADTPVLISQGLEVDLAGELWTIDRSSNNENAVQMTTSGAILSTFPLQDSEGFLDNPGDLAFRNNELYVVAPVDSAMHRFSTDGTFVETISFDSAGLNASYPLTEAIAYDGNSFWVAFGGSSTTDSYVAEVSPTGDILSSFLFGARIQGLAYEPTQGHLYATAGQFDNTIYVIGSSGQVHVPPGTNVSGSVGGGSSEVGGVDFTFSQVTVDGTFSSDFQPTLIADLDPTLIESITFGIPSNPLQLWDLEFTGEFNGLVELTFGYDDSNLFPGQQETDLRVFHQLDDGVWEVLPVIAQDINANTLTVVTAGFSPFAIGVIPEPTSFTLLAWGGMVLIGRRFRD